MNDQLLSTKLHPPIVRKDMVSRPRLIERLNAGLWQEEGFVRKLTLVSAPAGFGKTTLVGEWLSQKSKAQKVDDQAQVFARAERPFQAAWLSLDEGDNDPVRFLAYLIAALRQIQPEFGRVTKSILQLPQPPPPNVILTSLVNELSNLSVQFILAFDDYHAIHTPPIHQQLTFILDHQPANMHLVVLTREDPLLPVARLRASGQLLEIRQGDLCFTNDETAEFLRRIAGLSLGTDEIAALKRHTEGWAAGLQLAALSLRGCDDQAAFIHDFAASDRFILDYLVEEVFAYQRAEVQDFLLQTSILKRLSGPLCDAVAGRTGSAEMLHSLEQANLFIAPLDSGRAWYRYHHLFAELLHQRLRLSRVPESELHQRASRWYETQGFFQDAVDHALAAQDWGSAARLIGMVSEDMLKRGEVVTLFGWCSKMPQEVIYSSPELCLVFAWAAMLTSQHDLAAGVLERAEQIAPPGSPLMGHVLSAQAFLARSKRENDRAIQKSEQALVLLPDTEFSLRANIAMNLGLAYWHEGRIAEAGPVLAQACDLSSKSGNMMALLTAQNFLARIPAVQGKLHQAAAMLEKLIQTGGEIPILCLAHFDLTAIYLEWNDLPKAMEHFDKGCALSLLSGNTEFQQAERLLQAILAHAGGDDAGAMAALNEADQLGRDFPPAVRSRTAAFGVQMALERADPAMLAHWSALVIADVDFHSFYRFMGLSRARQLIAQGEKARAAVALKALSETASQSGWGYGLLVVRILQSLVAKTTDEAVEFISEALRMGAPEGFMRSFIDAGDAAIPYIKEAAHRGTTSDYAGQILAAMGAEYRKEISPGAILIEPLSEREIEVLRLVSEGLSNREIARKLVISPGTAKTHIHNLCGKLGVRNRTEAAMKAKELGLA